MPFRSRPRNSSVSESNSSKTSEERLSEPSTDSERTEDDEQKQDEDLEESEDSEDDPEEDKNVVEDEEPEHVEDEVDGPLVNPSKNITGDLKRILEKESFKLKGSFYSSKSYANAPNPSLNLEGLGAIGLPLSEAAAKRVISKCKQAPFGKGERTIVDTNVRDTWEMDAKQVKFDSPAWKKWMDKTVIPSVCESLGVNMATAIPRAELYKLLVYEKGSHFLPHQDTEKTPGMFATIVIILPSTFTGGSLKLSHARASTLVDASPNSSFATHVAAWYTDVYHSVTPVESGYRLALSYNLIHTNAPSLKPSVSEMSLEAQELKHVLLSWKQGRNPEHVIYLLDHMYSDYNLRASTLKGKDAHRIACLRSVAEQLRFRIALINVELHQSGQADDEEDYGRYGRHTQPSLDSANVEESEFKITEVYDLEGNELELNEDFVPDEEDCIPFSLAKTDPEEEEYEGYQGNYGGTMELWYRRTALLIWPAKEDDYVIKWDYVEYAEKYLGSPTSKKPTKNDREVVEELTDWLEEHVGEDEAFEVLGIITTAAVHWNDCDMWINACTAARLEDQGLGQGTDAYTIAEDVVALGFDGLETYLSEFVTDCSEEDRKDLLDSLEDIALDKNIKKIKRWVKEQRKDFKYPKPKGVSMAKPTRRTIPELISLAQTHGDTYLQDVILPEAKSSNPSAAFLIDFAEALNSQEDLASISPDVIKNACVELVSLAIAQTSIFPKAGYYSRAPHSDAEPLDAWMRTLEVAQKIDRNLIQVFCRHIETASRTQLLDRQDWLAEEFFPETTTRLDVWARSLDPPILPGDPLLLPFWQASVKFNMKRFGDIQRPIAISLHWCKDLNWIQKEFLPFLEGVCGPSPLLVGKLVKSTYLLRRTIKDADELASINAILKAISQTLALQCALGQTYTDVNRLESIMDTLIRCKSRISVETLTDRLLQHTSNIPASDELVHKFLSLLTRSFIGSIHAAKWKWPSAPISRFAVSTILRAVELLGPKSATKLLDLACDCIYCKDLEAFASDNRPQLSIKAVLATRKHVAYQLKYHATSWEVSTTTIKEGSPHTLQITRSGTSKPTPNYTKWEAKKRGVLVILDSLGTFSVQKEVMGEKWPEICETLELDPSIADVDAAGTHCVIPVKPNPSVGQTYSHVTTLKTGVVPPALIATRPTTINAAQPTKRPFAQAMGNQGASTSSQGIKKVPMEIIELSDSD